MTAKYVRLDRKETADCLGIKADKKAVAVFKYNLEANLAYAIQRVGLIYGRKGDDGWLEMAFIYEPPQEGTESNIILMENKEEQRKVDLIAEQFGATKIGCIIGQTAQDYEDEDFIMTADQLLMIAELRGQAEDFVVMCVGSK